ncbi:Putative disease resistance RPP13-like protein 1 [Linum perenne]
MAATAALVGGSFLSAFLQVLFDRLASRNFLSFCKGQSLNDKLLKKLLTLLNSVNGLLDDAEEKKIIKPSVEKWLNDLKDAVYEADDLLDEIGYESLKLEAESGIQTNPRKVWNHLLTSYNPFRKFIEEKLKDVLERLQDLVNQKDALGLREVGVGGGVKRASFHRIPSTSLVQECDVYGRDADKQAIIHWLLSDDPKGNDLGVILIVGMGGIGKTTLAQLVYNDESIRDRFGLQAWVCVSEEYDVFRLTKDMIEEVSRRPCDINSLNQLQLELKRVLKGHRFLLILDDVWIDDVGTWEMLRMPFMSGAKGSKIIVTTRNQNVASLMGTRSIYSLNQLDTNDCWLLFAKQAFGDEFGEHPQLEVVGREIVRKCKGIPLAAKALGGLLHSERDIHKWEKVLNSNLWDLPSNKILPALKLSYYYLPSHLKQCFAYCALFPADYEFKMDELILLWMAEGFVVQHEGNTDIEEIGEQYFHDLISRSLFQQSASDKSLVTMHDLIHDLAKYVSGEFCFRVDGSNSWTVSQMTRHLSLERTWSGPCHAISKSPCLRTFLQLHRGLMLNSGDPFCSLVSNTAPVTWLDWSITWRQPIDGEVLVNLLSTLKRLRVLSLSNYYLAADLFVSVGLLKHLRYLNLSGTPIERLFDSVGSLYNLQTLILNDCIKLSLLPDSIGKLKLLQHLNLFRTSIVKLPDSFNCLINLCHLYNGETKLKEMPPQMGKLSRLRKLTDFYIGKGSGSTIKELGQLHHLHGSLTVWNLQFVDNVQDVCVANLKGKKCLKSLKLVWKGDTFDSLQERAVLEQLQPNKNLECLSIIGYGGTKFPSWLGDSLFSTITSVELRECKHCSSLPPFGQLVSLTSLSIVACDAVVTVGSEFYGSSPMRRDPFISLKTLRFEKMQQWQEWNTATDGSDIGAFPILGQLYLKDCPNLTKALPRKLPYLETLVIEGCQQLDMATIPSNQTTYKMHLVDDYRDVWLNRCAAVRPHHLEIARFFCRSPVEGMELVTGVSSSLEEIEICRSDSLVYFPLHMFPKLKTLSIRYSASLKHLSEAVDSTICREASSLDSLEVCNCPNLVSFPRGGLLAPNMTQLLLQSCSKLKSLPERMNSLIPSLVLLKLSNCPELEAFLEGGLPSNLQSLEIFGCDKLIAQLHQWNLQSLPNLLQLSIGLDKNLESFPDEERMLPSSLTSLEISDLHNLKFLNTRCFQHLASLGRLKIKNCPQLQYIREDKFPPSLHLLSIDFQTYRTVEP